MRRYPDSCNFSKRVSSSLHLKLLRSQPVCTIQSSNCPSLPLRTSASNSHSRNWWGLIRWPVIQVRGQSNKNPSLRTIIDNRWRGFKRIRLLSFRRAKALCRRKKELIIFPWLNNSSSHSMVVPQEWSIRGLEEGSLTQILRHLFHCLVVVLSLRSGVRSEELDCVT